MLVEAGTADACLHAVCQLIPVFLDYGDGVSILLRSLATAALVVALAVGLFLYCHRTHPIVKGTSLTFCLFILSGVILGLTPVWILIGKPTPVRCTIFAFIEVRPPCQLSSPLITAAITACHRLSQAVFFGIILIFLLVKTWRIFKIFYFTFAVERVGAWVPTLCG